MYELNIFPQIGGGGVSIYYSHTLQMLFFSYVNGKSFMAPLKSVTEDLDTLFHINVGKRSVKLHNLGSILPTSKTQFAKQKILFGCKDNIIG